MDAEQTRQRDYMISEVNILHQIVIEWPENGDDRWKRAKGIVEYLREAI